MEKLGAALRLLLLTFTILLSARSVVAHISFMGQEAFIPVALFVGAGYLVGTVTSAAPALFLLAAIVAQTGFVSSTSSVVTGCLFIGDILSRRGIELVRKAAPLRLQKEHSVAFSVFLALTLGSLARSIPTALLEITDSSVLVRPIGYGSVAYPLEAATLWCQGLWLLVRTASSRSPALWQYDYLFGGLLTLIAVFCTLQYFTRIPEPYLGLVCFSPLEDIASFGSFTVICWTYFLFRYNRPLSLPAVLYLTGSLLLLALSWSRAAWLSGLITGATYLLIRRRAWFIAFTCSAIVAITILNLRADDPAWHEDPYIGRLIRLVRVEPWSNKDAGRTELYLKAVRMISSAPVLGHGFGSFYRISPEFASPEDAHGTVPDFAHNFLLQYAAENGLPAAIVLLLVICLVLIPHLSFRPDGRFVNNAGTYALSFSLVAYLLTQLTSNSLNIYLTHQFLFWYVIAALATSPSVSQKPSTTALPDSSHCNSR